MVEELNECRFDITKIDFGYDRLLLYMVLLGGLSALVEWCLHKLEVSLRRLGPTYLPFLRRTYKELVILGLASFVVILVRDFYKGLTKNRFQLIEFAHLLLLCVGLVMVLNAALTLVLLIRSKRRYDESFAHPFDFLKTRFDSEFRSGHRFFSARARHRVVRQLRLVIFSMHFVRKNGLTGLDFSKYLRKRITNNTLDFLDVGYQSWMTLCVTFFVGFLIAYLVNAEPTKLNVEALTLFCLGTSTGLVIISLSILYSVEVGLKKLARICGCASPGDPEVLLTTAEAAYRNRDRGNLESVPPGGTADDAELDRIIRGHLREENFDVDLSSRLVRYREEGVVPFGRPSVFVIIFRVLVLAQFYIVGITILVLLGYREVKSFWYPIAISAEFLMHIALASMIYPRIIREFAVIAAVGVVDDEAVNLLEETLEDQNDTNETIYLVAKLLYDKAQTMMQGEVDQSTDQEFGDAMVKIFSLLDAKENGQVNAAQLEKQLATEFAHHVKLHRLKKVFRALNCSSSGLSFTEARFLAAAVRRFEIAKLDAQRHRRECFAAGAVTCSVCKAEVNVLDIERHLARRCGTPPQELHKPHDDHSAAGVARPPLPRPDTLSRVGSAEFGLLTFPLSSTLRSPSFTSTPPRPSPSSPVPAPLSETNM